MKNTKKLLLLIVIILNLKITAYAATNDSNLVRNQIDGIYAIAPLSDRVHLYNLEIYRMNGKLTYCIEIGKKITTETYSSTDNQNEQASITNLTQEQLNYIKAILYFGYEYENHTDIKYYMAAQELIWEYLNNIDITWTNELDVNGAKINIDSYKNEIRNLAEKYITPLNLPTNAQYKIGTTNTMTDSNNSLSFYTAKSKRNNQISISGNQLTITISPIYTSSDTITLTRKKNYSESAKVYSADNTQIMMSVGNLNNLEHSIKIYIKGATLKVILTDKDTKRYLPTGQAQLEGSEYELYDKDNNLLYTYTYTNLDFFLYANLSYEKYYIKQKTPGKGYKKDENLKEVTINSLEQTVTLEEEVIKNTIEINKLYESKEGNKREKDITFQIYDNKDELYTSITTTETGPDLLTLPYGTYTMKQQNTTEGYKMLDDIEINIEEENNDIIKYTLIDEKIEKEEQNEEKEETTGTKPNKQENTPKTYDNILKYFSTLIASFITIIILKKKNI